MIVFKTFLKVLNKCKMPIIMYTVILVLFGGFSLTSGNPSLDFVESKPDIAIISEDAEVGITKDLIKYLSKTSNVKNIENNKDALNDALFYREVNYIIYIPKNFRKDFLAKKNPLIEVKSTKDYGASYASMLLQRYIGILNVYVNKYDSEEEIINKVNETLAYQPEVEITSSLDEAGLSNLSVFYNFANYSLLAGGIYVICLVLSSFKNDNIKKRTIISSMNYRRFNNKLLTCNGLFMLVLWLFYVALSYFLLGKTMLSMHGLICVINSLLFSMCCLTIAFLIGNLINDKNAINGVVNVVALGSSFLCGAFVPMEWLPSSILTIAHILPSYWYIKSNELLKEIEVFNLSTLRPIIVNMLVIVLFMIFFVIVTNIITKRKQKLG